MGLLRIPLREVHRELGAEFGEFAGWETPMVYESTVKEHLAVRSNAGVFDVSHMGRIMIRGSHAAEFLDKMVPKSLGKVGVGSMSGPTALLNERAGFRDDVMLYNLGEEEWMLVCNAANREKVLSWLSEWRGRLGMDAEIIDATGSLAMLALQGPRSAEYMEKLGAGDDVLGLKMLRFLRNVELDGRRVFLVSRSGWTGEDGFEIVAEPPVAAHVLRRLVELGVKPAGLAARDTLRLEVGFVLYGHDIDEDTNPLEARYWVYTPGKKDYVGYEALMEAMRRGVSRVRVGIKMKKGERGIPREGYRILLEGVEIGRITSGNYSPVLKRGIGMGYVDAGHALIGMEVQVDIRGRIQRAKILDFPLLKK